MTYKSSISSPKHICHHIVSHVSYVVYVIHNVFHVIQKLPTSSMSAIAIVFHVIRIVPIHVIHIVSLSSRPSVLSPYHSFHPYRLPYHPCLPYCVQCLNMYVQVRYTPGKDCAKINFSCSKMAVKGRAVRDSCQGDFLQVGHLFIAGNISEDWWKIPDKPLDAMVLPIKYYYVSTFFHFYDYSEILSYFCFKYIL